MLRTCSSCRAVNRIPAARLASSGRCGRCKTPFGPSATPIDVTDAAMFDDLVAHAGVPILIDFWAAWCGPCRMVAPEVAHAATELAGRAVVVKVDTERLPQIAARYRVQGIPNFVVIRDGAVAHQQAGAVRSAVLVHLVDGARAA